MFTNLFPVSPTELRINTRFYESPRHTSSRPADVIGSAGGVTQNVHEWTSPLTWFHLEGAHRLVIQPIGFCFLRRAMYRIKLEIFLSEQPLVWYSKFLQAKYGTKPNAL